MAKPTVIEGQNPFSGMEAVRLQIAGMPLDELTTPPGIDDRMTLSVDVVCTQLGVKRMKDGELRYTATMQVTDYEVKSGPSAPTGAPDLFDESDE